MLAQPLPRCPPWLWRTNGFGEKGKKASKGKSWRRRFPAEGQVSAKALNTEQEDNTGTGLGWESGGCQRISGPEKRQGGGERGRATPSRATLTTVRSWDFARTVGRSRAEGGQV